MHILFVHQNFPAQFGAVAAHLARREGFRSTFVSRKPPQKADGFERIQYHLKGGATARSHYCSRSFENAIWHAHAVHEALRARPDIKPDLIVGHSGFGSTVFLRELYESPIVNYFEYYYHSRNSDIDFRPDFPPNELDRLRVRARNAMILLDLENCDAGYSPTAWQRLRLPSRFHDKVSVIFDGVDTTIWRRSPCGPRLGRIGGHEIPDGVRLVTYVARGLEAMRGFDRFMKMARSVADSRPDVLFVVVGADRVCYGNDLRFTGGKSFREWVLAQDDYDQSRFIFTGLLPQPELARLLSASDLHVYLTVPFVLSWSLLDALACGATVLASDVDPVREVIAHGKNGLLTPFFDVEAMAATVLQVLDAPEDYRHLGQAGTALVHEHYSLDVCLPKLLDLYRRTAATRA